MVPRKPTAEFRRVFDPYNPRKSNESKDDRLDKQAKETQGRRPMFDNSTCLDEHREDTQDSDDREDKDIVPADEELQTPFPVTTWLANVGAAEDVDELRNDGDTEECCIYRDNDDFVNTGRIVEDLAKAVIRRR